MEEPDDELSEEEWTQLFNKLDNSTNKFTITVMEINERHGCILDSTMVDIAQAFITYDHVRVIVDIKLGDRVVSHVYRHLESLSERYLLEKKKLLSYELCSCHENPHP